MRQRGHHQDRQDNPNVVKTNRHVHLLTAESGKMCVAYHGLGRHNSGALLDASVNPRLPRPSDLMSSRQ